jgi:hypothetical protein
MGQREWNYRNLFRPTSKWEDRQAFLGWSQSQMQRRWSNIFLLSLTLNYSFSVLRFPRNCTYHRQLSPLRMSCWHLPSSWKETKPKSSLLPKSRICTRGPSFKESDQQYDDDISLLIAQMIRYLIIKTHWLHNKIFLCNDVIIYH